MVTYQNDPLAEGYCPDPGVLGLEASQALLDLIKGYVCGELTTAKGYIDEKDQALADQIAAIEQVDGLAEKLAQIDALLKEIDLENDGILELVNSVKVVADQALSISQANTVEITTVKGDLVALSNDLTQYKIVVENRFVAVEQRVTALEGDVATIKTEVTTLTDRIAAVETATDDIDGKIEDVETKAYDAICANNVRFITLFEQQVELAKATLTPCEVFTETVDPIGG